MGDKGVKAYKGNAAPTEKGTGSLTGMQQAAKRRLSSGGQPGGGPSGGKSQLSPQNGKPAGSMIKPNGNNGVYSTFVKENWTRRRRG